MFLLILCAQCSHVSEQEAIVDILAYNMALDWTAVSSGHSDDTTLCADVRSFYICRSDRVSGADEQLMGW